MQRWISKKEKKETKHILIETERKAREVKIKDIGKTPAQLERQAWDLLGQLSKVTTVDELLLHMRKYSGTLGDYSGFNSMLIAMQDPNATIVRSRNEWKYITQNIQGYSTNFQGTGQVFGLGTIIFAEQSVSNETFLVNLADYIVGIANAFAFNIIPSPSYFVNSGGTSTPIDVSSYSPA